MSDTSGTELILWRHAEAEDPVPGKVTDAQRALTPRGVAQAARMAGWLNARVQQCRVLASPAVRTCQTADALKRIYEMDPRVGLQATPQTVLAAAGWPDASGIILVVGHQPTLGETAALLLPGLNMDWNLRRGAIVWIARRTAETGKAAVTLRVAMTPEAISTA